MKIVIINGSPRINGLTAGILHTLERSLLAQGAVVEFYNLSELSMSQCRGCCACYTTPAVAVAVVPATAIAHPIVLPETWSPGPAVMVMFSSFVTGKALSPENVLI